MGGGCQSLQRRGAGKQNEGGEAYEDEGPGNGELLITEIVDEVAEDAGGDNGGEELKNAESVKGEARVGRRFGGDLFAAEHHCVN